MEPGGYILRVEMNWGSVPSMGLPTATSGYIVQQKMTIESLYRHVG
jgi:hypothetical protein